MRSRQLSLNALRVFNSAARHLNLLRAADELAITQGAASRQIQNLEAQIGAKLFERGPRGLRFTEAGDMLAAYTRKLFAELETVTEQISGQRSRQTLRIAVARSFAVRCLAHQIAEFQALHPWITLYLDGHRHMADLVKSEADAAIRIGNGGWRELEVDSLGEEFLSPVCSPEVAARIGGAQAAPTDISSVPMLHYAEQSHWASWLREYGELTVNWANSIYFSETVMMLAAAEASQGIAIARTSLVEREIASGALVRPWVFEIPDAQGYFFCCTPEAAQRPAVRAFRSWLLGVTRGVQRAQPRR